jgi:hypothetical protein
MTDKNSCGLQLFFFCKSLQKFLQKEFEHSLFYGTIQQDVICNLRIEKRKHGGNHRGKEYFTYD